MFEPLQKIGCDEEELYRGIRRSQKSLIMAEPFHLIFQPLQIAPHRNDRKCVMPCVQILSRVIREIPDFMDADFERQLLPTTTTPTS